MFESPSLQEIEKDPGSAKVLLVMVTGFLVLAWFFDTVWLVYTAGITGLISLIPPAANRIVWGWMKLASVLGWFNSKVLLTLIFYLIVTPVGLLFRLFGNDPLLLKDNKKSVYTFREHTYVKEDLENPW